MAVYPHNYPVSVGASLLSPTGTVHLLDFSEKNLKKSCGAGPIPPLTLFVQSTISTTAFYFRVHNTLKHIHIYRGSYLLSPVCSEYHQRNRILLPGSEWDRVVPRRQATTIYMYMCFSMCGAQSESSFLLHFCCRVLGCFLE